MGAARVLSIDAYRERFTTFYESLVEVYPDIFADGAPCRIGSTFRVPGAGGLDAQTFYMGHVLALVFEDEALVHELITLARAAYRGTTPPAGAVQVVDQAEVHEALYRATEAASGLTGRIGRWNQGTDLFANILTNVDCALQMAGIYDHAAARQEKGSAAAEGTMDQAAIDSLFD